MNYSVWAVVLMLAAGCATTFRPWKLSDVQVGMEREQVIAILGEPDSVETKDGAEILHYAYRENYNPPLADDSVHAGNNLGLQEKQLRDSAREYHYVVRMVDGKVMDYKELND